MDLKQLGVTGAARESLTDQTGLSLRGEAAAIGKRQTFAIYEKESWI